MKVNRRALCAARGVTIKAAPAPAPAPDPAPALPPASRPAPAPAESPAPTPSPTPSPDPSLEPPAPGPADPPAAEPASIAAPLSASAPTAPIDAAKHLFSGAGAIQVGVAAGTIEARRVAVLHGTIRSRLGTPIAGVRVTVADHPELGRTATQADGGYDLAVNGGGPLTLVFERAGYIPAQRLVQAPWQGHAHVDPLVMVPYADTSTLVDKESGAETQVALGPASTDADGTRRPVLVFDQGTVATMKLPDGTDRELGDIRVRMTEFTIGATGPAAMPAQLPPTSAYTYALELSVDEAVAAGATKVTFNKPVVFYTDNFIGSPVGTNVPIGYYDREQERWIAERDGRVVEVVSEAGGSAQVDVDGDGVADSGTTLSDLGIDDAERRRLSALYDAGAELWRAEIKHFTTYDCNYPYDPGPDAPGPDNPAPDGDDEDDACSQCGSIVYSEALALGEMLPITGSGLALSYRSDRVPGRPAARGLTIPLTSGVLPRSPEFRAVLLEVLVAGRIIRQRFDDPVANMSHEFLWDGLDAEGRVVQGAQPVTVRVGFVYGTPYTRLLRRGTNPTTFAMPGDASLDVRRGVVEYTRWQTFKTTLGLYRADGFGLGGWTLSAHHSYDPANRRLVLGDGSSRLVDASEVSVLRPVANASRQGGFAGDGGPALTANLNRPAGVGSAPDGTLFVADTDNDRVRVIGLDGKIDTYAGNGQHGFSGDGGPATAAGLSSPRDVAVAASGDVFIADTGANRVRRVTPSGTIRTVAGGGRPADGLGDGGPATAARLSLPHSVAVGPDGLLYIADTGHSRIRVVNTDGTIATLAGTGEAGFSGDGGFATRARLSLPRGLALDAEGNLLVADSANGRIRRITTAGRIETVAGGGDPGDGRGDGRPAPTARLKTPSDVAVMPDGSMLVVDTANFRLRRVTAEGVIQTHAGGGDSIDDGAAAAAAYLEEPSALTVTPDGNVYVADASLHNLTVFRRLLDGFTQGDLLIAAQDGALVYQFDSSGRHVRTRHGLTNGVIHEFSYDAAGRLARVSDPQGALLTIDRSAAGEPQALVARGGQRTTLALDANGHLASVTNPAGERAALAHDAGGLLIKLTEPSGDEHVFTYDELGRLESDTGPGGRTTTLARELTATGLRVTSTSAEGRVWTYHTEQLATGDRRKTVTDPAGAVTVTTQRSDGSILVQTPTGEEIETIMTPDSRFGLQSPVVSSREERTPGGRMRTTQRTRIASEDTGGVLSKLTETVTANGRTGKSVYTNDAGPGGTVVLTSPEGREASVRLDEQGRVVERSLGAGTHPISYVFDGRGRLASVGRGARGLAFSFDDRDRPVSRTDARGRTTRRAYDDADRAFRWTTHGDHSWTSTYDEDGGVATLTLPLGQVYGFAMTPDGLPDRLTLPAGGGSYEGARSPDRLPMQRSEPSGAVQTWSPDAAGRLAGIAGPETARGFTYHGATGLPAMTTWNRGGGAIEQTLASSFDGELLLSQDFSGSADGTFLYAYDGNRQVSHWTLEAAGAVRSYPIVRDKDSRPTREGPWTITRDPDTAQPTRYSDGVSTLDETHDGHGALASRELRYGSTQRYRLEVDYDAGGRVSERRETVDGILHTFVYAYDGDDRLLSVTRDGTPTTYTYDDNGNRTTGGATFDAQDRIEARDATTYTLDADGFLDRRGRDDFDYGRLGELLRAQVAGHDITYEYDGKGRLVRRQDGADSTQFLYGSPGNPVAVSASIDEAGVLTTYFYDDDGALHGFERAGARYAVGADQVGTPVVVTDASGAIVKRVERDAWGVVLTDSAPAFELPLGFAGGIEDPVTGLVRFGLRDYDPASGRFTARDPSFFAGSPFNLYAYAANDPVGQRDPTGLTCFGYTSFFVVGGGMTACYEGLGPPISTCLTIGIGFGGSVDVLPFHPETGETWFGKLGLGPLEVGREESCGTTKDFVTAGGFGGEADDTTAWPVVWNEATLDNFLFNEVDQRIQPNLSATDASFALGVTWCAPGPLW